MNKNLRYFRKAKPCKHYWNMTRQRYYNTTLEQCRYCGMTRLMNQVHVPSNQNLVLKLHNIKPYYRTPAEQITRVENIESRRVRQASKAYKRGTG